MDSILNITAQTVAAAAAARRRALAKKIGDGLVVLRAAPETFRSCDVPHHPYRQNSYLYYLTACGEAKTALLLRIVGGELREEIFFCRKADAKTALWDGAHLTPTTAKRQLQIADCADIARFADILRVKAAETETLYYLPGDDEKLHALFADFARRRRTSRGGGQTPSAFADISVALDDMRLVKDETEIALLRAACAATCVGVKTAMRAAAHARYEWEVDAAITAAYRRQNGFHAFPPIVAGGANACVLHYNRNDARINKNKLLLVDSGCELRGYAGDVTRTFPPGGVWADNARAVYEVVLAAQQSAIRAARPGARWATVENTASRRLAHGLAALGLCKGRGGDIFRKGTHRHFYPHSCGHPLGLDVHDTGDMRGADGKSVILRPGMVLTIEPGLYIPATEKPQWRGIGVRIEDDVLITKHGCEVLTADAPKTPRAIRQWMNG